MPMQQDAFGQSLVNKFWPNSGYAGAARSPYLPIVQPLMQSYDSAINTLMPPQQSTLGPAQISQPGPAAPGQSGKGSSGMGALMKMIDPAGGQLFGA